MSDAKSRSLCDFPTELLLEIGQQSDYATATCLSLTCHTFYIVLSGERQEPNPADKYALLNILQRSVPGRYLCHECRVLHPVWKSSLPYQVLPMLSETPECTRRNMILLRGISYRLPFWACQCVMDRHLFGPDHGLWLSSLNSDTTEIIGSVRGGLPMIRVRHSRKPLIFEDELFFRTTYTLRLQQQRATMAAGTLDLFHAFQHPDGCFDICPHVQFGGPQSYHGLGSKTIHVYQRRPEHDLLEDGSCPWCDTDYTVDFWNLANRSEQTEQPSLRVETWQRLDSFRDPLCEIWHRASTSSEGLQASGSAGRALAEMAVQQKWRRSEGETTDQCMPGLNTARSQVSRVPQLVHKTIAEEGGGDDKNTRQCTDAELPRDCVFARLRRSLHGLLKSF